MYTTCIHNMNIMYTQYTKHVYTAVIRSFTLYIMNLYKCVYKCTQLVYTMFYQVYYMLFTLYALYSIHGYVLCMLCIQCVCALCIKPLSSYYLLLYIYSYVYHQFYM